MEHALRWLQYTRGLVVSIAKTMRWFAWMGGKLVTNHLVLKKCILAVTYIMVTSELLRIGLFEKERCAVLQNLDSWLRFVASSHTGHTARQ